MGKDGCMCEGCGSYGSGQVLAMKEGEASTLKRMDGSSNNQTDRQSSVTRDGSNRKQWTEQEDREAKRERGKGSVREGEG